MAYYNNSKAARRRRNRRIRMLRAVLPIFVAIILIGIIVILGIKLDWFSGLFDSTKRADLYSYFQTMSDDTATVYLNGEITTDRLTVKDGSIYGDMDTIGSLNDNFYYEDTTSRLLYTTQDGVYAAALDSNTYSLDGNMKQIGSKICYLDGETLMVSLEYARVFTNFDYSLYGGTGEPYRVLINTEWGTRTVANITKDDVVLRTGADSKTEILDELAEDEEVMIIDTSNEDWTQVRTADLLTGFVKSKFISDTRTVTDTPVTDVAPINVTMVADYSEPIVLAWHNVTTVEAASYLSDYTSYLSNINTISPTWFALSDNEGTVASIASQSYVNMCHERGIKVWGLVDNMTYEVSTYQVLSDPDKRTSVINQLLSYASEYSLDGINIDFESVTEDAGPHFVQFVREFSLAAHKQGLVVSVDNYVPQGYTMHYNRKEQGVFADYVIIMGYDEHTSGSEEAGSVASIDFVLDGIEQTIADVPANKVINALPFYTRVWTVTDTGMITDVQSVPMATALASVANNGATATWDEETNQNYAEWAGGNGTNKVWLEDADSLRSKLEVMKNHNIGGAAVWQLAFSTDSAWEVINEYYAP